MHTSTRRGPARTKTSRRQQGIRLLLRFCHRQPPNASQQIGTRSGSVILYPECVNRCARTRKQDLMTNLFATWNRRAFLAGNGLAAIAAGFRPRYIHAAQLAAEHGEIYRQLGVRPLINARGTYTVLTRSGLPQRAPPRHRTASRSFIHPAEV